VLAYVFGGTALVALGAFSVFALKGIRDRAALIDDCKPSCASSDIDRVHNTFLVADVALAVGLVSGGLATYFFLAGRGSPTTASPSVRAALTPVPSGMMGSIGGTL
jgi:hypothetical protein